MGAIYARVAGTNHPRTGMPNNILVLPEAVQDRACKLGGNFETGALPTLTQPGDARPTYAPSIPAAADAAEGRHATAASPAERLDDRRELLGRLDQRPPQADRSGAAGPGADKYQQQAFDVITRGVAEAFDLSKEDPRTVARYDTRHLFRLADVHALVRHAASHEPARQADAAGPAAVRGGVRVRHRLRLRLGHARQRATAPRTWPASAPAGQPGRSRRRAFIEDVHERGLERQDPAGRHRRNGPHAADQQQRRPRPLRRTDAAAALRRRPEDGPGHRPVGPHRLPPDDRAL